MRCTAVLCGSKEKSQHNQWLGHCPLIYHWQSLQPPFENYKSKMLSLQSAPLQTEIWNCKRNFAATTLLLQPQHGQTGSEKINFASRICSSITRGKFASVKATCWVKASRQHFAAANALSRQRWEAVLRLKTWLNHCEPVSRSCSCKPAFWSHKNLQVQYSSSGSDRH